MVNVSFFPAEHRVYVKSDNHDHHWQLGGAETEEFICHFDSNLLQDSSIEHGLLRPLDVSRRTDAPSDRVSDEWSRCEPFNSTGLHSRRLETMVQKSLGKPFLRLITADERKLKPSEFLEAAGFKMEPSSQPLWEKQS